MDLLYMLIEAKYQKSKDLSASKFFFSRDGTMISQLRLDLFRKTGRVRDNEKVRGS